MKKNTQYLVSGAVGGNHNAASLLIKSGADVNAKDKDGKTTLMLAVVNGHQDLVECLLARNADLKVNNEVIFFLVYFSYIWTILLLNLRKLSIFVVHAGVNLSI